MTMILSEIGKAIFTSLAKLGRLITGHRPDPGSGPMPIKQAEEALALVTNLHELKLSHLDMEYNSQEFKSVYNIQDIENLKNDLRNFKKQLNQLRQHGHPVVKDVLQINERFDEVQLFKYHTALRFGPASPEVQTCRGLYDRLSQTHGVALNQNTRALPIFYIPDVTLFGDTGDLERLLNAMQYNTRGATESRIKIEAEAREQNLPYATDEGERRVAQANRGGARFAYNVWAQATQQERARQPGIQVPEVLLKPFRLIKRLVQKPFRLIRQIGQSVLSPFVKIGRGITNRFRQHQPAQVAVRLFSERQVTVQDQARLAQFTQTAPRAQRLAIASTSTQTAPQQPQITQAARLDRTRTEAIQGGIQSHSSPQQLQITGSTQGKAKQGTTGRGKAAHLLGGFQPRETQNVQGVPPLGQPPLGSTLTSNGPRLGPGETGIVSLGLLGLLVTAGWSSLRNRSNRSQKRDEEN